MEMTQKEIRKYLVFNKKNKISKAEAIHRLVRVHKLDKSQHDIVVSVAEAVYG